MLVYLYVNIDILIAFTKMPSRGECVSNRLNQIFQFVPMKLNLHFSQKSFYNNIV
nr:MAG TPA: hypothetical protein [Caudoviricetes sp.]